MGMTRVALREFKVLKKKVEGISFSLSLLWKCKKEGLNDSRVFSKKRWIPWIFYYSVCRGVSQFVFRRTNKKLANFFPLEARLTSRYVFFDQLKYFRQLKKYSFPLLFPYCVSFVVPFVENTSSSSFLLNLIELGSISNF